MNDQTAPGARLPHPADARSCPDVWGIDIGGANLKLARADGSSVDCPFPMWTDYPRLSAAIAGLMQRLPDPWRADSMLAVTMTGEMADCFASRRAGVAAILAGLAEAVDPRQCRVYAVGGQWLTVDQARQAAWRVAASNWHALARWCLRHESWGASDWQAVIDIGSTTVDIIPVRAGRIATPALTDRQRLERGQLVYTGMQRTAIQAIVRQLQVGHCTCPIVAERFATIDDVNLILGAVPEQPTDRESADGRPRTRDHAMARLARMIGDDAENLSPDLLTDMARQVAVAQAEQVRDSLLRNLRQSGPSTASTDGRRHQVFVSGHGRPLVERLKHDPQLAAVEFSYLDEWLTPAAARCAPAVAVAQLWAMDTVERSPKPTRPRAIPFPDTKLP